MKQKQFYIGYLVFFLTIVFFVGFMFVSTRAEEITDNIKWSKESNTLELEELQIIASQEMFFSKNNFDIAIKKANNILPQDNIKAVVVPHHLLASQFTAKMLKLSSGANINKVIIIGPNHENLGTNLITSAKAYWETPDGYVKTNDKLFNSFASSFGTMSMPEIFINEHSVGAIVPFVKYYFPDAEILPLILTSNADLREVIAINSWLNDEMDESTLLIISADFSHYLTKNEADQKDKVTKKLILDIDFENIIRLDNNDFVDSPASLALVVLYAKFNNLKTIIHEQGNSFDFLIKKPTETTSYFAISFEQ